MRGAAGLGVPVIDISPFTSARGDNADKARVARQIGDACTSIGFLVISGHGVPAALVADTYEVYKAFFELPTATKERVQSDGQGPGYRALLATALAKSRDEDTPSDLNERFTLAPVDTPITTSGADAEWFPENQWPDAPADFRRVATAYFHAMDRLAQALMRAFAVALDLDELYFDQYIDAAISRLTGIHYPPMESDPEPEQIRAGAHTDYGSLTILHKQPRADGLQVRSTDGSWTDITPQRDTFIVNIGDLLAQWTNDRWVSTMHRVINPADIHAADSARLSIAFFQQPNAPTVIAPLGTCVDGGGVRYKPITSGEHLRAKLGKSLRGVDR